MTQLILQENEQKMPSPYRNSSTISLNTKSERSNSETKPEMWTNRQHKESLLTLPSDNMMNTKKERDIMLRPLLNTTPISSKTSEYSLFTNENLEKTEFTNSLPDPSDILI